GIGKAVARAVWDFKGFALALPAPSLKFSYGRLQILYCQHRHTIRRRAVIGQQQQLAIKNSHGGDFGIESSERPNNLSPEHVSVVSHVSLEGRCANVEVLQLAQRGWHFGFSSAAPWSAGSACGRTSSCPNRCGRSGRRGKD